MVLILWRHRRQVWMVESWFVVWWDADAAEQASLSNTRGEIKSVYQDSRQGFWLANCEFGCGNHTIFGVSLNEPITNHLNHWRQFILKINHSRYLFWQLYWVLYINNNNNNNNNNSNNNNNNNNNDNNNNNNTTNNNSNSNSNSNSNNNK